jgi:uncharacterized protein YggE
MKHRWGKGVVVVGLVLLSTVWLLSGSMPPLAQAQVGQQPEDNSEPTRTLSVSGNGQASAQPDTATVTLGVETQDTEASAALTQNSEQMQAVIDALEEAGVAAKDIQTQSIQLTPRYEQPPQPQGSTQTQGPPQLVGFVATNTVQVLVRDLSSLGELLDAAVQAGGNQIQGISFEIEDPSALLDQAREAAWEDAMHKAEQLVKLAGVQLGPVLTISEFSSTPRPAVEKGLGAGAAAVPIQPGTQSVEVNLQIVWLLESPASSGE